jgi:hypothetical protein
MATEKSEYSNKAWQTGHHPRGCAGVEEDLAAAPVTFKHRNIQKHVINPLMKLYHKYLPLTSPDWFFRCGVVVYHISV